MGALFQYAEAALLTLLAATLMVLVVSIWRGTRDRDGGDG